VAIKLSHQRSKAIRAKEKMNKICSILGVSRQGYYKSRKTKGIKNLEEEMIILLVHSQRKKNANDRRKKALQAAVTRF
jgi:hypothetical protein